MKNSQISEITILSSFESFISKENFRKFSFEVQHLNVLLQTFRDLQNLELGQI